MRSVALIATLTLFLSVAISGNTDAWSADHSLRIKRPGSSISKVDSAESTSAGNAKLGTTGGVMPMCAISNPEMSHELNYTCCNVTSQYFPIKIVGPSRHFGLWLRLNLYPTLCHSVLCRRQCALNGYESCNALGDERTFVQRLMDNGGDCAEGSAQCAASADSSTCCKSNHSKQ